MYYVHYDLLNVRNIAELQDPFIDRIHNYINGKSNYNFKSL